MARRLAFCCMVFTLLFFVSPPVFALDWLVPGVRVWYAGLLGSYGQEEGGMSGVVETYRIEGMQREGLLVTQHACVNGWGESVLPPMQLTAVAPKREGIVWIDPAVLRNLKPSDPLEWLGDTLFVYGRHTVSSFDALPFGPVTLPLEALLLAYNHRLDIIALSHEIQTGSTFTGTRYYFHVDTGLLLSKTSALQSQGGAYVQVTLSEINYDFALQRAFPEDRDGPHTGYTGLIHVVSGLFSGQGIFIWDCISRYGDYMTFRLVSSALTSPSGQVFQIPLTYFFVDSITPKVIAYMDGPSYGSYTAGIQTRTPILLGEYFPFWIPPAALNQNTIQVWGLSLQRVSTQGGFTYFRATREPQEFGFFELLLDPKGYLKGFSLMARSLGLSLHTGQTWQESFVVSGPDYFNQIMKPARP